MYFEATQSDCSGSLVTWTHRLYLTVGQCCGLGSLPSMAVRWTLCLFKISGQASWLGRAEAVLSS